MKARRTRQARELGRRKRNDDGSNPPCPECQVRLCARSGIGHRRPTCGEPACVKARKNRSGNAARRLAAGLGGPEGDCRVCGAEIPYRPGKGARPVTCWQPGTTCLAVHTQRETKRHHDLARERRGKRCVMCDEPVAPHKSVLCASLECKQKYDEGNNDTWRYGRRIVPRDCRVCGTPLPKGQISLCGDPACKKINKDLHGMARRAAKTPGGAGSHTHAEWVAILTQFKGRCAYCDVETTLGKDHVLPLSRGGSNRASNLLPVCKVCNSRKRHRTLWEWSAMLMKAGLPGSRRTWWEDADERFRHIIIEAPLTSLLYSRTVALRGFSAVP